MSSLCLMLIKSRGLILTQSWHLDTYVQMIVNKVVCIYVGHNPMGTLIEFSLSIADKSITNGHLLICD